MKQELGKLGEKLAADKLKAEGYKILATNLKLRRGELDIIAKDGKCLVFIEVKTRSGRGFGTAAEAVTRTKAQRMSRAISQYIHDNRINDTDIRCDVVAIQIDESDNPEIEIIKNAFDPLEYLE